MSYACGVSGVDARLGVRRGEPHARLSCLKAHTPLTAAGVGRATSLLVRPTPIPIRQPTHPSHHAVTSLPLEVDEVSRPNEAGLGPEQHALKGTSPAERQLGMECHVSPSSFIPNPVNRARLIIGDQQRSVVQHEQVHRPTVLAGVGPTEESIDEYLIVHRGSAPIQRDHGDTVAMHLMRFGRSARFGSMLGHKDPVAILGREHVAGVELETQRGGSLQTRERAAWCPPERRPRRMGREGGRESTGSRSAGRTRLSDSIRPVGCR